MKYRICHFSQISVKPFYIYYNSLKEVKKTMDVLAAYDLFLLENGIRADYVNSSCVEMWDENKGEWIDWEIDNEYGFCDDIDEYFSDDDEIQKFDDMLFGQQIIRSK